MKEAMEAYTNAEGEERAALKEKSHAATIAYLDAQNAAVLAANVLKGPSPPLPAAESVPINMGQVRQSARLAAMSGGEAGNGEEPEATRKRAREENVEEADNIRCVLKRDKRKKLKGWIETAYRKLTEWFGNTPISWPQLRLYLIAINEINPNGPGNETLDDDKGRGKDQVLVLSLTGQDNNKKVFLEKFEGKDKHGNMFRYVEKPSRFMNMMKKET
jgi:hypothetical protein